MAYGIEIVAQNGKVFATPETPFMHMTKKLVLNLSGSHLGNQRQRFNTGLSTNYRMIPYVKLNTNGFVWATPVQQSGTWWLEVWSTGNVTATFYLFTNDIPPGSRGFGIELYAANGQRVYSSSTLPLQDHVYGFADKVGRQDVNVGFPCAVIPVPAKYWVQPIQGGQNSQFFIATPIAVGNTLSLAPIGTGIMPSSEGFSFFGYGGAAHYIRSDLYD